MNTLLVIVLALGLVSADIGLGYNYKVPQTSYGVPSYQTGGGSSDYSTGFAGANANQGGYQGSSFGQQNAGYQTGSHATSNFGGADSGSSYQTGNGAGGQYYYPASSTTSGFSGGAAQPSYQLNGGGAQAGYQTFNQYQTSSQYQSSAVQKYQEYYNQLQQQPAQVFKHFYVHAAPEEPEPQRLRQPIALPPPQKHYKIIFIKTPNQPAYPAQFVPVPQQNEEKTIVYVLVNKPEQPQDVVLPKLEQKPPTKPEVFFIKYKNQEDSQAVINNIVNDYSKGEPGVSVSGGQYQLGAGSGQYAQSGGNNGLYTQSGDSGQYSQSGNSGQYSQSGNSGQYSQSTGGLYSGVSSGQVAGSQATGQVSSGSVVSQTFPATDASSTGASSVAASGVGSGYENGAGSSGFSSAISSATSVNLDNVNAISTSQGVPHETYGPPKFRV